MPRAWRTALERGEKNERERKVWEEDHPPVTRLSVVEADQKRQFEDIGKLGVRCNLPCTGKNIPRDYRHCEVVDVSRGGIVVSGYEGESYFGKKCLITGKICIHNDPRVEKAIGGSERK